MVIFFADGRLGNQIFQYAFLNTLAKDKELILSTQMEQLLSTFDIKNKYFKEIPQNRYLNFLLRKFIEPYLFKFLVKIKLIGYIKQNRNKISALPTLTKQNGLLPVTLVESNFFQSEVFFESNKIDINIKNEFLDKAKKILLNIDKNYTKVFVHVRRGDYLFENHLDQRGIDLPKEYFFDAIKILQGKVKNPYFIFLSDDPSYCECCFASIKNKFVSKNSMQIDLAIMTLCEYGVVSNSSFSWWGAYLMENKKEVIFPKYWYGWKSKTESHIGIQPEWSKVIDVNNKS